MWLAAAALLTIFAPNIDDVSVNDQRAFLPQDVPSIQAFKLLQEQFPERVSSNSAVVVVDAGSPGAVRQTPATGYIASLTSQLQARLADGTLRRLVSPATADEQTAAALVSPDEQVALIIVSFADPVAGDAGHATVKSIASLLEGPPSGLSAYLTGDAAVLSAYDEAAHSSVESTTWLTILLVVVILLIVYRSPVSPLVPLATIALAYLISRGLIAILGANWLTISGYTNIFIIVVLFGAGTDYCLFLISRFREEMAVDHASHPAVVRTVGAVGETITSSAATVVVGLSTMALAELGLYNTSGPSVAIAVLIGLAAGLTLTPALLSLLGGKAFWPRKAHSFSEGRFWPAWASRVTRHPLLVIIVVLAVLVPLAVYGQGLGRDFDLVADLSASTPARQGYTTLSQHLDAGATSPLTVLIRDGDGFETPAGLSRLQTLEQQIAEIEGVSSVSGFTSLLAERGTLQVDNQLADLAGSVREAAGQLQAADPAGGSLPTEQLASAAAGLTSIGDYLRQLAGQYPAVMADTSFQQATGALLAIAEMAGVDTGQTTAPTTDATAPTTTLPAAPSAAALDPAQVLLQLQSLSAGLEQLQATFAAEEEPLLMLPSTYLNQNQALRDLRQSYISADAAVARISVVLRSGPYTAAAMQTVKNLRRLASADGSAVLVEGTSSIMTDLRDASNRDIIRALISVLLGIFLVLIWLLRSLVAPLYLLATILLSYASTLGIVRLVFVDWRGSPGITWWVPMFMFVMLVALGMDYNIFLMGRVKEEVARLGNTAGIRRAVGRTGAIITSAGIIMAGTFAAMMSANILGLVQIGFAVTVGVLLDTFVVRTALVPALAVLLGRFSWWPRRLAPEPAEDRS